MNIFEFIFKIFDHINVDNRSNFKGNSKNKIFNNTRNKAVTFLKKSCKLIFFIKKK